MTIRGLFDAYIRSVSCVGKERVKTNVKFLAKNVLKPIVKTTQKYLATKDGTQTVGISINPSTNFVSFIAIQKKYKAVDKGGKIEA